LLDSDYATRVLLIAKLRRRLSLDRQRAFNNAMML